MDRELAIIALGIVLAAPLAAWLKWGNHPNRWVRWGVGAAAAVAFAFTMYGLAGMSMSVGRLLARF